MKYEIRKGTDKPCELWSIVYRDERSPIENFVCDGTHTYCKSVQEKLEK